MAGFSHIAIIYNPNSTGDAASNAQELSETLTASLPAVPIRLLPTKYAGHAEELAYDFACRHPHPLVISASGDGGYNEVINGVLRAQAEGQRPVAAVLPSGNANDHARTMHDRPLAELILGNAVTELDVLRVTVAAPDGRKEPRYAHSYAGIGLTPEVAVELNKHSLNTLAEALIITRTFWLLRPVSVVLNGKKRRVDSLICSTIPEMAKVLTISNKAKPQDGLFEVVIFRHRSKLMLLLRLIKGIFGHLGAHTRAGTLTMQLREAAPLQVDGEILEASEGSSVIVEICPRLLRTVAEAR